MPKRYSPEIRRTALEFVNQGQTQIEVGVGREIWT